MARLNRVDRKGADVALFRQQHAQVIVLGNEKGGTGKSTTAMHVTVSLMARGHKVAVIDLDPRQKTLTRYLENRRAYAERHDPELSFPDSYVIEPSALSVPAERERDEAACLNQLVDDLDAGNDFIVMDCPGNDTHLARLAHSLASTLITPVNDSFVDLDLLGQVDADTYDVRQLSLYSEAVWEGRKRRALAGKRGLDWLVLRNRMSGTDSYNKRRVDRALRQLQEKVAFRYVPGLSERMIYRELFPQGLTLVDYSHPARRRAMTMSHLAARHELRALMDNLRLQDDQGGALAEVS
jgi:chromosome partitioning protein